ncbi:MAG TPA: alginate lyase family protein [Rhodothermales bacterium]|nr:alginate lyase family protein [Rhodothermales bacterium]
MRFFQTVRRLRARQAVAQLGHRVCHRFPTSTKSQRSPPAPAIRLGALPFIPPLQPSANAGVVQTGGLTFLNRTERVGWPPAWEMGSPPKLWRYNLHYHDFLWKLPFDDAVTAVRSWIDSYPNGLDRVGWDPYPVSLRVQNWCMYFFGRHRAKMTDRPEVSEMLWASIFQQIAWLQKRIEWHLLGNHILENGAALSLAGATFDGATGDQWLQLGLDLLGKHLDDNVLTDGGHAERSPMYHSRLCQMLENLSRAGNEEISKLVQEPLKRAWAFLPLVSHPDGGISLFNDAALGIYPGVAELGMERSKPGVFALPDSGYYGALSNEGNYVICDAGPIGPDHQPGHAHGDTLSFELSVGGVRFVVDSGVLGYEGDRWRTYARSTRAHNTIELNRVDQSDFWGVFRVGRRAYPRSVTFTEDDRGFSLEGEHTGYDHLTGRPVHRRRFRWIDKGVLMVRDRIKGGSPVWARSHIHLHPDVAILPLSDRSLLLQRGVVSCTVVLAGAGRLSVEPSWYFPEFGCMYRNYVLVVSARGSELVSGFCMAPGKVLPTFDLERGARVDDVVYGW